MSNETPELIFARQMRDFARSVRCMADDHRVAAVALSEEQRLTKRVEKLERELNAVGHTPQHAHAA